MTEGLTRWVIKQTIFLLILATALFLSAGRLDWARGWLYLGLVAGIQVLTALVLIPHSPDLLIERSRLKHGAKKWDICFAVMIGYSTVLIATVSGLEIRLTTTPASIDAVALIAVLVAVAGTLFTLWAMLSNPFFSGIVRIQTERGHTVASTGPYRYVRHPGYVGMLVFTWATPFMLGSWWAFWAVVFITGITILRTALEDRVLQNELEGYSDYAQRVRYRMVPFIW